MAGQQRARTLKDVLELIDDTVARWDRQDRTGSYCGA